MLPNVLPSPSPDAHVPVLAREVGALLDVHPGELIVDCTFGAGGHRACSRGISTARAAGRDRPRSDDAALCRRAARDVGTGVQVRPMHGPFASCLRRLVDEGAQAGAVLMDLGMSSMQVDAPARGFSYMHDAPLDMRMDPATGHRRRRSSTSGASATSRRSSSATARSASRARSPARSSRSARSEPFESTLQLVATIKRAIPTPSRFGHGHPAKRVFQALRIAVNDELGQLEDGLESALELCAPGGRVAVISFHSLEDRMVKQRFVKSAKGCICPPDLPVCGCGRTPEFRLVTSKAVRPNTEEVAANPRSASARLRVVQREVTRVSAVAAPRSRPRARQRAAGAGARRRHLGAPDPGLRGGADRHRHAPGGRAAAEQRARRPAGASATAHERQQRAARAARRPAGPGRARGQGEQAGPRAGAGRPRGHAAPLAGSAGRGAAGAPRRPTALGSPHPPDARVRQPRDLALAARTVQVQLLDGARSRRRPRPSSASPCPSGPRAGRSSTAPARSLAISYQAVTVGVWPARVPDRTAFAQALSKYVKITPAEIEGRMAGSAQFVFAARRIQPSTWTRDQARPDARPARDLARDRAADRAAALLPAGGLAAQVVGVDGDGISGVELSRNDVLSARDGLASVSKVNDRPTGDAHWARVLHVREPVPGKTVQLTLDTRIQSLVQKQIAQTLKAGTRRPSRRSCSTRAPAASSRWPRRRACRPRATAPATPPSGGCARSPTSTSPARRSSS